MSQKLESGGTGTFMIVCQCLATNEASIRHVYARGGTTVRDVSLACGAGSDCAGCIETIQAVLDQCVAESLHLEHHRIHSIAFEKIKVGN